MCCNSAMMTLRMLKYLLWMYLLGGDNTILPASLEAHLHGVRSFEADDLYFKSSSLTLSGLIALLSTLFFTAYVNFHFYLEI